jgi:hypothetical protein
MHAAILPPELRKDKQIEPFRKKAEKLGPATFDRGCISLTGNYDVSSIS